MLQKHPIEEMHYSSASYGISRKKSQTFEHPSKWEWTHGYICKYVSIRSSAYKEKRCKYKWRAISPCILLDEKALGWRKQEKPLLLLINFSLGSTGCNYISERSSLPEINYKDIQNRPNQSTFWKGVISLKGKSYGDYPVWPLLRRIQMSDWLAFWTVSPPERH